RTDLKIYKLANSNLNEVTGIPEVIEFSYPEQVDFSEQMFSTNFDCEALLSWGDDLLIFTKNWGNQMTSVYRIPKTPGTYEAELLTEIDVNGFITGACYDPIGDYIVLTGYTILEPFVFIIPEGDLTGENMSRLTYEVEGGFQIEAIEQLEQNKFILSREGEGIAVPRLFYLDVDWVDSVDETEQIKSLAYPNPSQDIVHISLPLSRWELHDDQGKLVLKGSGADVDLSSLNTGMYLLKVEVDGGTITHRLLRE
ncbi:MAG: T9SS type A sorting domain-containing protein, partial [Flavobacteriales bacterium]